MQPSRGTHIEGGHALSDGSRSRRLIHHLPAEDVIVAGIGPHDFILKIAFGIVAMEFPEA